MKAFVHTEGIPVKELYSAILSSFFMGYCQDRQIGNEIVLLSYLLISPTMSPSLESNSGICLVHD